MALVAAPNEVDLNTLHFLRPCNASAPSVFVGLPAGLVVASELNWVLRRSGMRIDLLLQWIRACGVCSSALETVWCERVHQGLISAACDCLGYGETKVCCGLPVDVSEVACRS